MERLLRQRQNNRRGVQLDVFGMRPPVIHRMRGLGFGGAPVQGEVILRAEALDNARRVRERALQQAVETIWQADLIRREAIRQQIENRRSQEIQRRPDQ